MLLRLFVYGTLQGEALTGMARWLDNRVIARARARVCGRLVVLANRHGWYPALLSDNGRVCGEVCTLRLSRGELALLDAYEGREYRRAVVRARTANDVVTAQAYLWRMPVRRGMQIVPGGDFLAWAAASRRPILSSRNGRKPNI